MRVGVNPLIWINDDAPELGAHIPLARCLAEARQAGYEGIELGHRFPTRERELRALLDRHGLALVSGWYGGRLLERGVDGELDHAREHLALLRAMGCTTLIYGEVSRAVHRLARPLSTRPVIEERAWDGYLADLDRFAERVRDHGIQLALHHHVGTVVQTPEEIARVLDGTSSAVGLLLDTGHFAYGARRDDALPAFMARYAERVAHVHLKDVRRPVHAAAVVSDAPFLDAVCSGIFTVPGDGCLELAPVVRALTARGYGGWIVVEAEQDPRHAHPLTYAKLGFENVKALVAQAKAA